MKKKMLTFQKVLDVYTTYNKHFPYIRTSAVTLLLTCTRDTKLEERDCKLLLHFIFPKGKLISNRKYMR